jgi:hypothetical protein
LGATRELMSVTDLREAIESLITSIGKRTRCPVCYRIRAHGHTRNCGVGKLQAILEARAQESGWTRYAVRRPDPADGDILVAERGSGTSVHLVPDIVGGWEQCGELAWEFGDGVDWLWIAVPKPPKALSPEDDPLRNARRRQERER